MTTDKPKTPTREERAFDAFKKKYPRTIYSQGTGALKHLTEVEKRWWDCFCAGYLAAAKVEKIEKLLDMLTMNVSGGIYGKHGNGDYVGEYFGNKTQVIAKIRKILEAEEKEEKKQ